MKRAACGHCHRRLLCALNSTFSNIGIGRDELIKHMDLSENTVRSRLKLISSAMLIENRQKGRKYYLLNLEEADKLFEE